MRHYLHVFSTFDPGGPQVRTAQILDRLGDACRHTVVAMDGRTACATRVDPSVRVELVAAPPPGGAWANAGAIARLLGELEPDLCLTYNWGAVEALLGAWRARFRAVVHHEEGFGPEESERLLLRRNWTRRALLRQARAVIVPSRNLERIARDVWQQPASRLRYLPNGVDLARFAPAPRGDDGTVVVGSVSSFRPVKNQQLMLRAFARVGAANAQLLLIGDGPDLEACRALATELGVAARVTFAGAVPDTAVAYPKMDVFAMSSRTEQMPIVLLEAMACGLPAVATDVGDTRAMVADCNRDGVVAPGDVDALAAVMARLVADAGLRAQWGAANRARCEAEFESDVCLGRYEQIYAAAATPVA